MEDATDATSSSSDRAPHNLGLDFELTLTSGVFAFFIGEERKRFDIHIYPLKRVSRPLAFMMSNGHMAESLKKEATLSDTEPGAFGMLVEYAYNGVCGVMKSFPTLDQNVFLPSKFRCHTCSDCVFKDFGSGMQYPFCTESCRSSYAVFQRHMKSCNRSHGMCNTPADHQSLVYCVIDGAGIDLASNIGQHLFCIDCDEVKGFPPYTAEPYSGTDVITNCSEGFSSKLYPSYHMSHMEIRDHMRRHLPKVHGEKASATSLLRYAKLYVLATKYMVDDLPDICLNILHVQLLTFEIRKDTISELVQLVLYAYENTSCEQDITTETADKLRELVMSYIVDRAGLVMHYKEVRHQMMVGAQGAPGIDFLSLMYG